MDQFDAYDVDTSLIATAQVGPDGHGLGRIWLPDERDNLFLMATALEQESIDTSTLPTYKYYSIPREMPLDQGSSPQCVEFSWNGWLLAWPTRNPKVEPRGTLYCEAQALDPWPGDCTNPQYDGSSVRAGAKALQNRGLVSQYLWAKTTTDLSNWLLAGKGPVVLGTAWFNSMFYPNPTTGLVTVDRNSGAAGGHAYLCIGYSRDRKQFRFVNSWGRDWGQSGRFWINEGDVQSLLDQYGEACTAVEQRLS